MALRRFGKTSLNDCHKLERQHKFTEIEPLQFSVILLQLKCTQWAHSHGQDCDICAATPLVKVPPQKPQATELSPRSVNRTAQCAVLRIHPRL